MKRRVYCCDASRDLYEDYYVRQNGGEIPVFAGRRFQRGHGIGSVLDGFFRRLVLPFFKTHGKRMLTNAIKTGMEVADDVLEGQSLKESAKKTSSSGYKTDGVWCERSVWIRCQMHQETAKNAA